MKLHPHQSEILLSDVISNAIIILYDTENLGFDTLLKGVGLLILKIQRFKDENVCTKALMGQYQDGTISKYFCISISQICSKFNAFITKYMILRFFYLICWTNYSYPCPFSYGILVSSMINKQYCRLTFTESCSG